MSRTHKTKPFWVKLKQGHLATRELHDHRDGACDLTELGDDWGWPPHPHCRHEFVYTGTHVCCCAQCHRDDCDFDKRMRKREHKRSIREWEREYESPDEVHLYETECAEENVKAARVAHAFCPACYKPV